MKKEPMLWGILAAACISLAAAFSSVAQDDTSDAALEDAYDDAYGGDDPYADAPAESSAEPAAAADDPYADDGADPYADDGADPYADDSAAGADEDADAADSDTAAAEEPEDAAVEIKPRPAEIMPLTVQSLLLDVAPANGQFVAVGDRGAIVRSSDGSKWEQVPVPVRSALTSVAFADAQHGWAVGHDATVVATTDGGKTWTLQVFMPELEQPFLDVLFLDAQRGMAVGAYGLFYVTEDGGQTWNEADAPEVRDEELHFNAIAQLGNGSLLIAGEAGMMGLSEDGGATWKRIESPYDSSLFGALPHGEKGALVFGLRGNAFMTDDVAGGSWTTIETESVASMFGGAVLPSGEFAMVGLNGVILVVDAAGQVRTVTTPAGTPLSGALAHNGGLLTVGESGVQPVKLN